MVDCPKIVALFMDRGSSLVDLHKFSHIRYQFHAITVNISVAKKVRSLTLIL